MSYKMPNIYPDQLQRIIPAKCFECGTEQGHTDKCRANRHPARRLHIDEPMSDNVVGTGWITGDPISYVIVHMWVYNDCLQKVEGDKNLFVLSERGQRFAERRIPDSEVRLPPDGWWGRITKRGMVVAQVETDEPDEIVEGLLFSKAGTCQLCRASMDKFGQISHAKSHVAKGHPVVIEEERGKKIARIKPGADITPMVPLQSTTLEPGITPVGELYSTTGICQLCPAGSASVHIFGRISHAKSRQ
jgi:hypothetical protein